MQKLFHDLGEVFRVYVWKMNAIQPQIIEVETCGVAPRLGPGHFTDICSRVEGETKAAAGVELMFVRAVQVTFGEGTGENHRIVAVGDGDRVRIVGAGPLRFVTT